MRLREIQFLLAKNMPYLTPVVEMTSLPATGNVARVSGRYQTRAALEKLLAFPPLTTAIREILALPAMQEPGEPAHIRQDQWSQVAGMLHQLKSRSSDLHAALGMSLPEEDPYSISLGFEGIGTFAELKALINDLEAVFGQPVSRIFGEQISFGGAEPGSLWVVVGIGQIGIAFIYGLCRVSQAYSRDALKTEATQNIIDKSSVHASAVQAAIDDGLGRLRREFASDLTSKYGSEKQADPETIAVVTNSIKELSLMFRQGMQLQLPSNAPSELASMPIPEKPGELVARVIPLLTQGAGPEAPPGTAAE